MPSKRLEMLSLTAGNESKTRGRVSSRGAEAVRLRFVIQDECYSS